MGRKGGRGQGHTSGTHAGRGAAIGRLLVGAGLLLAGACRVPEAIRERAQPATPHEAYARALEDAGLDSTALGRDWLAAASSALRRPAPVALPFREAGYFAPHEARAVAWAISLREGQRLVVEVQREGTPFAIFGDLYRMPADSTDDIDRVESLDEDSLALDVEAERTGTYVLRLQPELLRGGSFTVTIRAEPSLAFPVSGRNERAVQSLFGVGRDGGRRRHHGIDIFAPRGTPVLAATDGVVRSTTPSNLGGKVVWLSDVRRRRSIYYAHLDSQAVTPGQVVRRGDTLGFVGNTGNARTTPPHLHFGIYRRGQGPVDPFPFVRRTGGTLPVVADLERLGDTARATSARLRVMAGPADGADTVATIARLTPLLVDGVTGRWLRVRLPGGELGYVAAASTEGARRAVRSQRLAAGTAVLSEPGGASSLVARLDSARTLPVLGEYGMGEARYALVEVGPGRAGWAQLGGERRGN